MKKILIVLMILPFGLAAQIKTFQCMDSLFRYVYEKDEYYSGYEVLVANDTTIVFKRLGMKAEKGSQKVNMVCDLPLNNSPIQLSPPLMFDGLPWKTKQSYSVQVRFNANPVKQ